MKSELFIILSAHLHSIIHVLNYMRMIHKVESPSRTDNLMYSVTPQYA